MYFGFLASPGLFGDIIGRNYFFLFLFFLSLAKLDKSNPAFVYDLFVDEYGKEGKIGIGGR